MRRGLHQGSSEVRVLVPKNLNFGGGLTESIISPAVLVIVLIAGVLICVLPRTKAIIPFLAVSILIPTDQVLVILGLHFPILRILALFGLVRLLWTKLSTKDEILSGGISGIDKAIITLTVFTAVNGALLWRVWAEVIYQFGNLYSAFGVYFLIRLLIRDEEDVKRTLRVLACVTVLVAAVMIGEQVTGKNLLYSTLGGARSYLGTVGERGDHLRATGPFAHPNLAGTFGGIVLPLFVGLWWKDKASRKYAALGVASAAVIPFAASSSTALSGLIGGVIAFCFWPLRRRMRAVRWGIIATLIGLQCYMTSPVWHIISDIDLTGSSSSYHRYMLVDQCIRHFWDWMLIGTRDYANWAWDMWDLSDQYVGVADPSGLIPLVSFLAILVLGFKYVGRARSASAGDKKQELFIWGLGASLFANVVAFFGIAYFDQTGVVWDTILAMVITATAYARNKQLAGRPINVTAETNPGPRSQLLLGLIRPFAPAAAKDRLKIAVRALSAGRCDR